MSIAQCELRWRKLRVLRLFQWRKGFKCRVSADSAATLQIEGKDAGSARLFVVLLAKRETFVDPKP